jgi:type II secretory pathway pseudopilin PulG
MLITMVPMTSSEASGGKNSVSSSKRNFRMKRHSRAWWRRYRARMKRKRIAQRRRQILLAQRRARTEQFANGNPTDRGRAGVTAASPATGPRGTWSLAMPNGWSNQPQMVNGELNFRLATDGRAGTATLSVVSAAAPEAEANAFGKVKRESLAGVPNSSLRRLVIDRMIKEDGWVVNDYQRELGGRKVFVVVGRTPGTSGSQQSRLFYFTEVNGRIYSLSTNVPVEVADHVAADSEKVITAFNQSASKPSVPSATIAARN